MSGCCRLTLYLGVIANYESTSLSVRKPGAAALLAPLVRCGRRPKQSMMERRTRYVQSAGGEWRFSDKDGAASRFVGADYAGERNHSRGSLLDKYRVGKRE